MTTELSKANSISFYLLIMSFSAFYYNFNNEVAGCYISVIMLVRYKAVRYISHGQGVE
jgi:hypothetical protein